MPLAAGTRVGPYEVVSLLGAGGMGEVYRARDTKLGRDVALKVLSSTLVGDSDRLARFEQEAQLLASLNHPHIGAIYGLEESVPSPGSGQPGLSALVLELIEGPSLAETIGERPMALAQVLTIGEQIADALMAAHDKGITHRDIKPANVVLTAQGDVKVLDFGLAKIAVEHMPAARTDLTQLPGSLLVTTPGVVMGTVAYMSPEQASGQHTDRRTDLFSLGVVLYQMTTGRLPFSGSTDIQTLDLIRRAEPEAIARFRYEAPSELVRIIRKCLEKEVERRYQSAQELLVDLRNLKRDSGPLAVRPAVDEARRHNLPEQLTSFVGRDRELAEIERLLASTRSADVDRSRRIRQDATGVSGGCARCCLDSRTVRGWWSSRRCPRPVWSRRPWRRCSGFGRDRRGPSSIRCWSIFGIVTSCWCSTTANT